MPNSRTVILCFLFLFWLFFGYIWLVWGWQDTNELLSPAWWFDEAGHMLYGVMGSLTLLYCFQQYAAGGIFRFMGRIFLAVNIVSWVSLGGVAWEAGEFWWDVWWQPEYFDWLAKAQSDRIDTSVDILVNMGFSILTMILYGFYNILYGKLYPEEEEKFQTEELIAHIKHISKKISNYRHKNIRHLAPALREFFGTMRSKWKKNKTAPHHD